MSDFPAELLDGRPDGFDPVVRFREQLGPGLRRVRHLEQILSDRSSFWSTIIFHRARSKSIGEW